MIAMWQSLAGRRGRTKRGGRTMRGGMPFRCMALIAVVAVLVGLLSGHRSAAAVHESTNTLVFAPVPGSPAPEVSGEGVIAYRGGGVQDSRWTVQLRFSGLAPATTYVAVIQGRFGATDTPEAAEFTTLCVVATSATGDGGCWWYLVQMQHVGVVQLRTGTAPGDLVAQATRGGDGPGSITSLRNDFSPPEASPAASPVTGSPVSTPVAG